MTDINENNKNKIEEKMKQTLHFQKRRYYMGI